LTGGVQPQRGKINDPKRRTECISFSTFVRYVCVLVWISSYCSCPSHKKDRELCTGPKYVITSAHITPPYET